MNVCSSWDVKGCPASMYLVCKAYERKKNCWEVEGIGIPCCKRLRKDRCPTCEVFQKGKSVLDKRIRNEIK